MNVLLHLRSAVIISALALSVPAFAQQEAGQLIKSGAENATKLTEAYLRPVFKGFGIGLNSGWSNTGSTKNLGRFDIRLSATGAFVPQKDKSFDLTKLGLSPNIRPANPNHTITPTAAGDDTDGPELIVYDETNSYEVDRFRMPAGTGLPFVPTPQLQITMGLPRGIDVSLRGFPEIDLGEDLGSVKMIGAGIKIEPLRLISKTVNKIMPVDLALAFGFTRFDYSVDLDVERPDNAVPEDPQQNQDYSNQRIEAKISGISVEAIVSKKLAFFTPFLSVGYNSSTTDGGLRGNYPIISGASLSNGNIIPTYSTFTDPVNIKETYVSNMRANLGFQLNLAFFRLYSSYSLGEYNSFNAGIGFGIGK